MNKIIWISAAVLSVAACAKNEVIPVNSGENQEITFNVAPKTKADPQTQPGEFSTGNVFASWAYYLPTGKTWEANKASAVEYISNAEIAYREKTKGSTEKVWKAGDKTYYWPKNGSLTFFAYSLNKGDLQLEKTADKYNDGNSSLLGWPSMFHCEPLTGIHGFLDLTNDPNTDFLVADIKADQSANTTTTENGKFYKDGVPTLFRHMLSKILFNVKTADSYTGKSFDLISITFKKISHAGHYSQFPSESGHSGFNPVTGNARTSVIYTKPTKTSFSNNSFTAVVGDKELYIPQTFLDDSEIEVVYTITTKVLNSADVVETVTKTIKLKDLFPKKYDTVDHTKVISEGWEMGKKYTINLTFTLDEILWDPAVQEWEDVNIGADTAPIIVG